MAKKVRKPLKRRKGKKMTDPVKSTIPASEKKPEAPKPPEVTKQPEAKPLFKATPKEKEYTIKNIGQTHAKELKPGVGIFEIPPGGTITVKSKEVADSLVQDSQGKLILVD